MDAPIGMDTFAVRQRLTFMVNRYEVRAGGRDGALIALAEQKRMALRESVTFFADEAKTQPLFGFKARQVMDLGATYDITDARGQTIGQFKKDFGQSMLRSTWLVEVPGQSLQGAGRERSQLIAILRRVVEFSWPVHFDFVSNGAEVPFLSIEREWALRDTYLCRLPAGPQGQRLDWRVGACLAVACDALMAR